MQSVVAKWDISLINCLPSLLWSYYFCSFLPLNCKIFLQISNHLELIKPNPRDDADKQRKDAEFASAVFGADIDLVGGNTQNESFMGLSDVKHCGKMRALEKLMSSWVSHGDKILLFSYSVRWSQLVHSALPLSAFTCCLDSNYYFTRP